MHASLAVLAWAFFFPLGSILLRLIDSKNAIWVHAGIQGFATLIYIVAVGTGIHLAEKYRVVSEPTCEDQMKVFNVLTDNQFQLDVYHPILGLMISALMFVQVIGGIVHHLFFRKYLRRTVISYIHIWLGRILVTAGIINGGLGLMMAYRRPTVGQIAAYIVLAGIMWVIFIAVGFAKSPVSSDQGRHRIMSRGEREVDDLGPPRMREKDESL